MTISKTDSTPAYTDLGALTALKRGAAKDDPAAIRKVAEQFESMFTRMMLKSMRDAVGPDPMFGSDQEQMYQGMADDQMSVQLSKGKGLGLADMLIRQLQKLGVKGAGAAAGTGTAGKITAGANTTSATFSAAAGSAAAAYSATQRASANSAPASDAVKTNFVNSLWRDAQRAGQQLGIDPRNLVAQAALETNWGRNLPQDSSGRASNNLFGIKASADWAGPTVTTATQEYQGGVASNTTAQFRGYSSTAQSFQDYVALLRDNPRYSTALNTGGNVQAFAAGLQRGGYATDPDYATKISAISHKVAGVLAPADSATDLKLATALPITANTGAL